MPDTPEPPGLPGDVAALRAENGRLREANERLRMLLEDKEAQIAELNARNAELGQRVARLERLISRNSGNSSMPPSTDDLPGKNFVYSDLHGTVVVHDRYQNYDSFDGISHPLCCQHLLRDLEDAA